MKTLTRLVAALSVEVPADMSVGEYVLTAKVERVLGDCLANWQHGDWCQIVYVDVYTPEQYQRMAEAGGG